MINLANVITKEENNSRYYFHLINVIIDAISYQLYSNSNRIIRTDLIICLDLLSIDNGG